MRSSIPNATKKRFPQYLRVLQELQERGNERVFSYQIGNMMDISEYTVRKDFMFLSVEGKTASGYDINLFIKALEQELGFTNHEKIILIGVGVLGNALLKYNFVSHRIGKIVCAFDCDKQKTNKKNYGVPVYDMELLSKKIPRDTTIAILAIPKEDLETVINQLMSLKVKAILNFTDGLPRKRKNIKIYNIDLAEMISKTIYDFQSQKK